MKEFQTKKPSAIKSFFRNLFSSKRKYVKKLTRFFLFNCPPLSYTFLGPSEEYYDRVLLVKKNFVVTSQMQYQIIPKKIYFSIQGIKMFVPIVYIKNNQIDNFEQQLIIYSHGNSSDIGHSLQWLTTMAINLGVSIVTYDPRGYGLAQKFHITEESTYEDLELLISFIIDPKMGLGYKLTQIVLWGFSLGSGAVVELAKKYKSINGLILEAPLASCFWRINIEDKYCPTEGNCYDSYNKICHVKCPILILHGKADQTIPSWHSQILFDKYIQQHSISKSPGTADLIMVDGIGHNDFKQLLMIQNSKTFRKLDTWLMSLLQINQERSCSQVNIFESLLIQPPEEEYKQQDEYDSLYSLDQFKQQYTASQLEEEKAIDVKNKFKIKTTPNSTFTLELQSIKPKDIPQEKFILLKNNL